MRPIDADALLKDIEEYIVSAENTISEHPDDIRNYNNGLLTAIKAVTDAPTIELLIKGKLETPLHSPIGEQ